MSQRPGMTGPFWHAETEQHYWYDEHNDRFIFQDGRSMRRPESVPRASLLPPPLNYQYTGSPPGPNAGYLPNPSNNAGSVDMTSAFNNLSLDARGQPSSSQQRQPPAPAFTGADGTQTRLIDIQEGKIIKAFNPTSQVHTLYQTGPAYQITDPGLLQDGRGRSAYRLLLRTESEGDTEQLFSTFRIRSDPRRFFKVGRVFMLLWVEPAGEQGTRVTDGISTRRPGTTRGRYGEEVFSKVRRFVVIRESHNYCSALPITTYGERGVGKPHVKKSEHAIIHTGRTAPDPLPSEEPSRGEEGMRPDAIRVEPDDREDKLDPRSRLDFGKVHTIQHNIKVKSYGKVHDRSLQALTDQFNNCWHAPYVPLPTPAPAPAAAPIPSSSRNHGDTRALAGGRRESMSSGHRSQPAPASGSDGSQAGRVSDSTRRELIADQQERARQYWALVDQHMSQHRCSQAEAVAAINAHLVARQEHARRSRRDDYEQ